MQLKVEQTNKIKDEGGNVRSFNLMSLVQPDQINMAVFFWQLVKSDLSSLYVYSSVHWTIHFLQGSRNTRPCITGHPVFRLDHAEDEVNRLHQENQNLNNQVETLEDFIV